MSKKKKNKKLFDLENLKFDDENYELAKKHLKLLDPNATEFTFQCFHSDRKIPPTKPMHGTLKEWWESICRYNKDGYGAYVTINKTNGKGRRIKDIVEIRSIWQEDDGDGKKLPFKPSFVIESSSGKYHRYLLTKNISTDKIDKQEFDRIQKYLVKEYNSDKNARDITRVLRLAGTYNVKPSLKEPFKVTFNGSPINDKRFSWKKICKKVGIGKPIKKSEESYNKLWHQSSDFDFQAAVNEIAEAKSYYEPLTKMAMSLANGGTPKHIIVKTLESLMVVGGKRRPKQDMEIWEERYEAIEQFAESAINKVNEEKTSTSGFKNAIVTSRDFVNEDIQAVKYLIDPLITEGSINMIHASRGLGKTFFSISLGAAVASGSTFIKWNEVKQRKVLYVDGELPYARLREQYDIACKAIGMTKEQIEYCYLDLMTGDRFKDKIFPDLTIIENQEQFNSIAEDYDLIIFDNIATVFKTAEDRQSDWKGVQDWLISLRSKGVSTILIHHDNKKGDAQRGYSNKEDVMDTVIHLKKPVNSKDTDGAKFNVTYSKSRYFSGIDAKSFGCELMKGENTGSSFWVVGDLFGSNYDLAVEHFKEGTSVTDIARMLNISSSAVSQIKTKAINNGDIGEGVVKDRREDFCKQFDNTKKKTKKTSKPAKKANNKPVKKENQEKGNK